jgi:DNA (cytosine-5)-methyltransferase 1
MKWNEPAPTITGGFQTPGRGRFIHPRKRRVLTPHEAARIQGFPDWFDFAGPSGDALNRAMLGKWIGDAVPSIMGAAAAISALG